MPAKNVRTVDLLVGAFDLSQRRKFTIKTEAGDPVLDLYFRPITRADRKRAQSLANSEEALDISTQMLCQLAELQDGSKAFASADAAKLQHELPESVLNELELFLFNVGEGEDLDSAKKSLEQDSWLYFEFFLACELGMTVSKLRTELSDAELMYFAAYYELKNKREEQAMNRGRTQRR